MACQKINGSANSSRHGNPQRTIMHRYPFFLLRTAKRYKKQVGTRIGDAALNLVMVHLQKLAKRRRIMSGNDELFIVPLQIVHRRLSRFRSSPQEKQTIFE